MADIPYKTALIVGAGHGISAALARALSAEGVAVGMAARDIGKLEALSTETGAKLFCCDASQPDDVHRLFTEANDRIGEPDIVIYNASGRLRGPLAELDPATVHAALDVTAFGAFLVVQQAAKRMQTKGKGAILLTGATASVKALAQSAPFAMGKFALRALAQSAARELGPKGIHVVHFIIDGLVRSESRPDDGTDMTLDSGDVADAYLCALRQRRSAWSHEVDLRPWLETF